MHAKHLANSKRNLQMLVLLCSLPQIITARDEAPFIPPPLPPQQRLLSWGEMNLIPQLLFIIGNTGPLKCALCWARWQHLGALSAAASGPVYATPRSSNESTLGSAVQLLLSESINQRSRHIPPQPGALALDGHGGSPKSWWCCREIQ